MKILEFLSPRMKYRSFYCNFLTFVVMRLPSNKKRPQEVIAPRHVAVHKMCVYFRLLILSFLNKWHMQKSILRTKLRVPLDSGRFCFWQAELICACCSTVFLSFFLHTAQFINQRPSSTSFGMLIWSVGAAENKGERIMSAQVILLVSNRLSFYFLKSRGDKKERVRWTDFLTRSKDRQVDHYAHRQRGMPSDGQRHGLNQGEENEQNIKILITRQILWYYLYGEMAR